MDDERRRSDRVLVARIAAGERWARIADRMVATAPVRSGLRARFQRQVDPAQELDAGERARRADALMAAHMLRLARQSAKARRRGR